MEDNKPQFRFAGFWIRLIAFLIDILIVGTPLLIFGYGSAFFTHKQILFWISLIITFSVIIFMNGKLGGSPGKLLIGLNVVDEKGEYIGIKIALLRYIGYLLSIATMGIGYIMIMFTDKKQGLHDRLAKTYVIYKNSQSS